MLKSLKKVLFVVLTLETFVLNDKFYKDSWKEFEELESIDKKYYSSDFYAVRLNKYGVKCETSLRFWKKKKNGLMKLIPVVGFSGILDTGKEEDLKMIRDKLVGGKEYLVELKVF